MSISQILQNGLSGLKASQAGLAVISQNVANANTIGYSRQSVSLEQLVINGVSSGVSVGDTKRLVDNFLTREVQIQKASEGEARVVADFYNNIETRFGTPSGNNSLSADLSSFGAAPETLAIHPEDPAPPFHAVATRLPPAPGLRAPPTRRPTLRGRADSGIDQTVDEINAQLSTIFVLNTSISRIRAQGGNIAALEDQRDVAITDLSKNNAISTFTPTSGDISILTQSCPTLLDAEPHDLDFNPATSIRIATHL